MCRERRVEVAIAFYTRPRWSSIMIGQYFGVQTKIWNIFNCIITSLSSPSYGKPFYSPDSDAVRVLLNYH